MDLPRGSFGAAVRKARLEKGYTQEQLAELLVITPMHVKQLESERRNPSAKVLIRLVIALDLHLGSLFMDQNSETKNDTQDLRNKIDLCLDRCSVRELAVAYATIEAMLKKS